MIPSGVVSFGMWAGEVIHYVLHAIPTDQPGRDSAFTGFFSRSELCREFPAPRMRNLDVLCRSWVEFSFNQVIV